MRQFPDCERREFVLFKKLNSPAKIQDFLNTLPFNFEKNGDTCSSPLVVLDRKMAQCLEGALLAAAILWYHDQKPLLLDLRTVRPDDDHVLALFKQGGRWGAISKTNHAVLRYRDPIYTTIRELALSYFNEYFLDNGKKTLRSYSKPLNLLQFDDEWLTIDQELWGIYEELDNAPHVALADKKTLRRLRKADAIEIEAGKITEWKAPTSQID